MTQEMISLRMSETLVKGLTMPYAECAECSRLDPQIEHVRKTNGLMWSCMRCRGHGGVCFKRQEPGKPADTAQAVKPKARRRLFFMRRK